jgi:hypothetical protein
MVSLKIINKEGITGKKKKKLKNKDKILIMSTREIQIETRLP